MYRESRYDPILTQSSLPRSPLRSLSRANRDLLFFYVPSLGRVETPTLTESYLSVVSVIPLSPAPRLARPITFFCIRPTGYYPTDFSRLGSFLSHQYKPIKPIRSDLILSLPFLYSTTSYSTSPTPSHFAYFKKHLIFVPLYMLKSVRREEPPQLYDICAALYSRGDGMTFHWSIVVPFSATMAHQVNAVDLTPDYWTYAVEERPLENRPGIIPPLVITVKLGEHCSTPTSSFAVD